jgi:hypothetical protein
MHGIPFAFAVPREAASMRCRHPGSALFGNRPSSVIFEIHIMLLTARESPLNYS